MLGLVRVYYRIQYQLGSSKQILLINLSLVFYGDRLYLYIFLSRGSIRTSLSSKVVVGYVVVSLWSCLTYLVFETCLISLLTEICCELPFYWHVVELSRLNLCYLCVERQSRQVRVCTKVPPSSNKRSFYGRLHVFFRYFIYSN